MRLIDADVLKEYLEELESFHEKEVECWKKLGKEKMESEAFGRLLGVTDCLIDVECQETVDAVPVIRCKDCKYCDSGIDEDGKPFLKCLSGRSYGGTNADDYCSWAERR